MNLVLVTSIFPPQIGGPATYCFEVARRLRHTHQVSVIAFGERAEQIEDVQITLLRQRYPVVLGTLLRQLNLLKTLIINYWNIDIVYAQGPIVVGATSLLFTKIFSKTFILKFVGDPAWEAAFGNGKTTSLLEDFISTPGGISRYKLLITLERYVLQRADYVIVPSEYLKKFLITQHKVDKQRIKVIRNAVDEYMLDQPPQTRGNGNKTCRIVSIGRLVSWKCIDDIIRALGQSQEYLTVHLEVIGDGPERKSLEKLADELGLKSCVNFNGRLNHDQTLSKLKASDIFILNSIYEGMPHTVLEAMSVGVAVIATDIPGTREVAIHNKTALLVPPGDVSRLTEAILRMSYDLELRNRMIDNALIMIRRKYLWVHTIKKLESVLTQ